MTEQLTHEEKQQRLYDILKKNDIAMMTTISNGKLVSRPMGYQEVERDGDLWFFTMKDTEKIEDIQKDNRVNVSFSQNGYVSISGTAEIIEDEALKKKYWNKAMEAFLNTNYDDPNMILVKVSADSAEYWGTDQTTKTIVEGLKSLMSKGKDDKNDSNINESLEL